MRRALPKSPRTASIRSVTTRALQRTAVQHSHSCAWVTYWTYEPIQRSGTDQRVAGSFQDFSGQPDVLGMVYSERGIYRPGETAKLAGMFRIESDAGLRPVAGEEVRIEANDANGGTVFTNRVKLDAFGAFATDVVIPKTAHVGESRFVATLQWKGHSTEASKYVLFSDFKASEFKVDVVPEGKSFVRGDELAYSVRAEYLFGGPMASATAHTTVTRQDTGFAPPGSRAARQSTRPPANRPRCRHELPTSAPTRSRSMRPVPPRRSSAWRCRASSVLSAS